MDIQKSHKQSSSLISFAIMENKTTPPPLSFTISHQTEKKNKQKRLHRFHPWLDKYKMKPYKEFIDHNLCLVFKQDLWVQEDTDFG